MQQLEFTWRDASALGAELEELTGLRLRLAITDNTATVMSVKHERGGGAARLRLHRMFLGAGPEVVRALAAWVKSPRSGKSAGPLNAFVRQNTHQMRARAKKPSARVARGRVHDLQALFDAVNAEQFEGRVDAGITWGRLPKTRARRSIRFGSYAAREHLVRIHPLLDQEFVPEHFVRYIVFHEMLHAFLGVKESASGRRTVHGRDFQHLERAYSGYAKAVAWQENPRNLKRLLSRKSGIWDLLLGR